MYKLKYLKYKKKYLNLKNNLKGGNLDIFNEVKSNNINNVKEIINNNPEVVDQINYLGITPLFFAVINKNKEIIEFLISKNANINYKDNGGFTVLFYAILSKDCDFVSYLLKNYNNIQINIKDNYNHTPLYFSCLYGTIEIVELLIDYGANIDEEYENGKTIIFLLLDQFRVIYNYQEIQVTVIGGTNPENDINPENQSNNLNLINSENQTSAADQKFLELFNEITPKVTLIYNVINSTLDNNNNNNNNYNYPIGDSIKILFKIIKIFIDKKVNLDKKNNNNTNLINYATQTFIEDSKLNINSDQVVRRYKSRINNYKEILSLLKPNFSKITEADDNNISALNIIENKGYIGDELKNFFYDYLSK